MTYPRFLVFNVVGGVLWVLLFVLGGYLFGNIPFIKSNFSIVILALIVIPGLPSLIEFIRIQVKRRNRKEATEETTSAG